MNLDSKEIGAAMRCAREKRGLTVAELAERAEIAVNTVRLYEAGRFFPGLWNLWHLADVLGVALDELVGRERHDGEKSN